jgi:hypothetical protein
MNNHDDVSEPRPTTRVFHRVARTAADALRLVSRSRGIIGCVVVLSTVDYANIAITHQLALQRAAGVFHARAHPQSGGDTSNRSFAARTGLTVVGVLMPLTYPLRLATDFASPWAYWLHREHLREVNVRERWRMVSAPLLFLVLAVLASRAFVENVLLLLLLRTAPFAQPSHQFWEFIRSRYLSLLILYACLGLGEGTARSPLAARVLSGAPLGLSTGWAQGLLICLPSLILILAPYAIAAQGTSAWRGMRSGILIFWRNAGFMAVLLAFYCCVIQIPPSLSRIVDHYGVTLMSPVKLIGGWVLVVSQSLLGAWLAAALLLVVTRPKNSVATRPDPVADTNTAGGKP